ncbi:hypothetical protein Vadar_019447 [Vaccinium darrowii]|uniref:Uncharacterized protein n=1 Tax=Vaccinium darrowii TaxID=229202 RepID=A0ACB7YN71_9ERIC|nr:hypothetical protein Vadar_019447 [Vaccinium darrowii]
MDCQQTSQSKASKPKGKGKDKDKANEKEKQSRRIWTQKEEEGLLLCMLEEFKDGVKWKAGNGFKSGFFGAVEVLFHKMFPGTTIRANPNIESKVKNWKEKYGLLADMQRLSGFGWNHDTHSVVVDSEDVWEDYVKFNPKANGMNGRSFPMYPSWQILFGKDRAIGDLAEDPPEIRDGSDEEIEQGHQESFVDTNDCYTPRFEDGGFVYGDLNFFAGCSQPAYPSTPTSTPTSHATATATATANPNASTAIPPPKKGKKLTRAEAKQVALSEQIAIYMQESKDVMEKLVTAVGTDQRLSEKRNLVFGMLENLNLEIEDMLTANAMILATDQKVEEFHTVLERYRRHWVGMLLEGKLNPKTT